MRCNNKLGRGSLVRYLATVAVVVGILNATHAAEKPLYLDSAQPVEMRVDDLMKRMTVLEKIGQTAQYTGDPVKKRKGKKKGKPLSTSGLDDLTVDLVNAKEKEYAAGIVQKAALVKKGLMGSLLKVPGIEAANYLQRVAESSRLKIPLLIATDAIHGHGMYTGASTVFPTQLTMASSFLPEVAESAGRVTAREMRATGYHWTFSPNIEVLRDQRWGRSGETFGEDTLLTTEMGLAMTRGYQQETLDGLSVLACAKHLAGGGESFNGINAAEAYIPERTLQGVYLPPFEKNVKAGAITLMAAHNAINGIPCHAHKGLLTDTLRAQWGFDGFVVSDWNDVSRLYSVLKVAKDLKEASYLAFDAGVDVHMHGDGWSDHIEALIKEGRIDEEQLDRAVRPILEAKFRLGLFENRYINADDAKNILLSDEHKGAALTACRKSLVLLKNEQNILPISPSIKSILITGPHANNPYAPVGDWVKTPSTANSITILDGIKKAAPKETDINFVDIGIKLTVSKADIERAVEAAKQSELAVVAVGENSFRYGKGRTAGENIDFTTLDLPGNQLDLIKAIHATGSPIALVMINRRAMSINWSAENVPAILEAWEPGIMGGQAIGEALFGHINPGGKLPVSFPRSSGHLQCYYNHTPLRLKKYGDSTAAPIFPFGHGLSYTTFKYSNLNCPKEVTIGTPFEISVDVTNTGDRDGDEVVMVFLNDVISSVTTPIKELEAFHRITLEPGETKRVTFTLRPEALSLINAQLKRVVDPGKFSFTVGTLKGQFEAVGEVTEVHLDQYSAFTAIEETVVRK